jgi:hypothetical protein
VAPRARKLTPAAFCAVLLVGALGAFRFPMGSEADFENLRVGRFSQDAVVVTGNSVMKAASTCDAQPQTIAQRLASLLGRSVADRSAGGQTLHESIAYAGLALDNPHVEQIVIGVSAYQFHEWPALAVPRALFFKLLLPAIEREPLALRFFTERDSPEGQTAALRPFTYRGRDYPEYEVIKSRYFEIEKRGKTCPENDGTDRVFLEAYYDHLYAADTVDAGSVRALAALAAAAVRARKRLVVALLPVDYELMAGLRPDLPVMVRRQVSRIVTSLRAEGAAILDLSEGSANAVFADRWCACGHLAAEGRQRVAAALAQALRSQ